MVWVHGTLAALCLAVGALHVARAVLRRREIALELSYAAMGVGMADMLAPVALPGAAPLWVTVFLLCGGWFGALMLRARSPRLLDGEALHLVVGSAAMLFMLWSGHGDTGDTGAGGHAAHAGSPATVVGLGSAVALVLGAYFVLHTLRCTDRLRAARSGQAPGRPPAEPEGDRPLRTAGGTVLALRAPAAVCTSSSAELAHLVMTVAMAVSLVAMI
jgi:hypothetical protein